MKNKLFVIYIGGAHEKSLIELHDIRFIIAKTIEDTYNTLRESWWGTPKSLHLDAWGELKYADGYDVILKNEPSDDRINNLFFVNLGGYDQNQFTELHKNIFVVASNANEAKFKSVKLIKDWHSPHKDYHYDVEKVISINEVLSKEGVYIHLTKNDKVIPFEFTCKYVQIGK